jgi:hypothetical protein
VCLDIDLARKTGVFNLVPRGPTHLILLWPDSPHQTASTPIFCAYPESDAPLNLCQARPPGHANTLSSLFLSLIPRLLFSAFLSLAAQGAKLKHKSDLVLPGSNSPPWTLPFYPKQKPEPVWDDCVGGSVPFPFFGFPGFYLFTSHTWSCPRAFALPVPSTKLFPGQMNGSLLQ